MPELTVAAGLARGLIEVAASKGAREESLLARAGLSRAELEDQDNRIPLPKYVALMRAGKELCNDPALALHYGETPISRGTQARRGLDDRHAREPE